MRWQVEEPGIVTLRVFDNTGRAVRTIQNGYQAAGRYTANWNGICNNGMRAANGVLFYTFDAPGIHLVVKAAIVSR
jgi:flagellar hook assembly protein FlgD